MKFISAFLAVLGVVFIALILVPQKPLPATELHSSSQCLECHADVAAEWKSSHHAFAYENPEVRKLSNDFSNQECIACHAPQPVLKFAAGERVLARQSQRALGVDCLACHAVTNGGVATSKRQPASDAPCRPQYVDRLSSVDLCASCHNQHETVEQWRGAPDNLKGNNCLDCHMPSEFRQGGRRGRNHGFPASHDLTALQSAVSLDFSWDADGPIATLVNDGCGHNFPTDERSRAADLKVQYEYNGIFSEWELLYRYRDPYRDETDLTNTQLPAGESMSFNLDATATSISIKLLYKTNPFMPDFEAVVIHSIADRVKDE
jgi:nitrate/TMAO reductase-like tetraheme cytochrome c subunit